MGPRYVTGITDEGDEDFELDQDTDATERKKGVAGATPFLTCESVAGSRNSTAHFCFANQMSRTPVTPANRVFRVQITPSLPSGKK